MEPSPFGDLFGEPQDIFAEDVRSCISGLVRMELALQAWHCCISIADRVLLLFSAL